MYTVLGREVEDEADDLAVKEGVSVWGKPLSEDELATAALAAAMAAAMRRLIGRHLASVGCKPTTRESSSPQFGSCVAAVCQI